MYWLPGHILALNGYYCIVYTYKSDIFSPNPEKTVAGLTKVRDAALNHITRLKTQGHQDFSIFGFSLGTLIALMVANNSPDTSKVILNLVGTNPAEAVWTWDQIQSGFKRQLENKGITLENLSRIWAPVAPINNVDNLKPKKLLIYLAERDKLIPIAQGRGLVEQLQRANYDYQLIVNRRFGHMLAGIYNVLNTRIYLKFLKS